jgi:hypothetical protein
MGGGDLFHCGDPPGWGPGWRGGDEVAGLRGPSTMPVTRPLLLATATRWPMAAGRETASDAAGGTGDQGVLSRARGMLLFGVVVMPRR